MEIKFVHCKFNLTERLTFKRLVINFMKKHDIKLNSMTVDLRKTKNEYTTKGMFGGFIDMYDAKRKSMYFNPFYFIEFNGQFDPRSIAHLCMHELTHVKQIQNGTLKIRLTSLTWKGKVYRRMPFHVDLFNKIRVYDPDLAERYHKSALPWEVQAYDWPAKFMKQPLWKAYAE